MVRIFLIRHGQANSKAKDEVSYDRRLGKIQASWLGRYFKKNESTSMLALVVHLFVKEILRRRETHKNKEIIRDRG